MAKLLTSLISAVAILISGAAARSHLTLNDVLQSSSARYPEIIEAMEKRDAAVGNALARRGAFDVVFSAENASTLSGYYDGISSRITAERELGAFGARVYGGYGLSRGDFPIYKDAAFTDRNGEFKVGVVFSLLRDREIDRRRIGVKNADLDVEIADLELALAMIGVQQRAADSYFRWVTAGRQLRVYEDLLALAESRQVALEREVKAGARAKIFLTENAQNIARRRVLVVEARQRVNTAANNLSMYYRDDAGAPITPDLDAIPPSRDDLAAKLTASTERADIDKTLSRRPDLRRVETRLDQYRNKVALARNEIKPRLDLSYEMSNDFGPEGLGGPSRDGLENIVGLRFSVPIGQREARGALAQAESELAALEQRRRLLRDKAEIELRNIVLDVDMAEQRAALVEQEAAQSDQMESAERKRFSSGASDFFLVNLREETAANARVRLHQADFDWAVAQTAYLAATVDLEALGLSSGSMATPVNAVASGLRLAK